MLLGAVWDNLVLALARSKSIFETTQTGLKYLKKYKFPEVSGLKAKDTPSPVQCNQLWGGNQPAVTPRGDPHLESQVASFKGLKELFPIGWAAVSASGRVFAYRLLLSPRFSIASQESNTAYYK